MLLLKNGELSVRIQHDFFDIIDDSFLDAIAEKARAVAHTNGAEAILAACLSEYRRRCLGGLQPPAMSYVKAIFSTRVERFRVSRMEKTRLDGPRSRTYGARCDGGPFSESEHR